jgi:hypothetical protein
MTNTMVLGGVTVTVESARALEAVGMGAAEVAADVERLRSGEVTEADLLAECMDGADASIAHDWVDYVNAVATAAGLPDPDAN